MCYRKVIVLDMLKYFQIPYKKKQFLYEFCENKLYKYTRCFASTLYGYILWWGFVSIGRKIISLVYPARTSYP